MFAVSSVFQQRFDSRMNLLGRWTLGLLGMLVFASASPASDLLDEQLSAQVDELVENRIESAPLVGVSLAVVHEGKPILLRNYGHGQLEPRTPVSSNTRFQIASVSKSFAAACIVLLAREGVLTLDDSVRKWIPEAPSSWASITIRHLMAHTSGVLDYVEFEDFRAEYQTDLPREEILKKIFEHELTHEPGTKWKYSNSGYFLLGVILERASGSPYAELLQKRVFEPVGMVSSLLPGPDWEGEDVAVGYDIEDRTFVPSSYNSRTWSFAAGAILSTAEDLARWSAALDSGELLTDEEKRLLWTPTTLPDGTTVEYGLGWMIKPGPAGRHFVFHLGNKPGFSASIVRVAEDRLSVVVLSNRTEGDSSKLANDIGGLFFRKLLSTGK